MFRFRVKNFQSIEDQEFVIKGFSILVGSSNLGKSAVVRALRAILFNEFSQSFVRSGTDTTELSLEFLEPNTLGVHRITYTRSYKKSINEYVVDFANGTNEVYSKVGVEIPDVLKKMGFDYLEIEKSNDKVNTNFQSQLEGLFLFNSSEVFVSSLLNKIFNVDKYENALRLCNRDTLGFSKEFKEKEKLLVSLGVELSETERVLNETKGYFDEDTRLVSLVETLKRDCDSVGKLSICLEGIRAITEEVKSVEGRAYTVSTAVTKIEAMELLKKAVETEKSIRAKKTELSELSRKKSILLKVLGSVQTIGKIYVLASSLFEVESIKTKKEKLSSYSFRRIHDMISSVFELTHLVRVYSAIRHYTLLVGVCEGNSELLCYVNFHLNKIRELLSLCTVMRTVGLYTNVEVRSPIIFAFEDALKKSGRACGSCGNLLK